MFLDYLILVWLLRIRESFYRTPKAANDEPNEYDKEMDHAFRKGAGIDAPNPVRRVK